MLPSGGYGVYFKYLINVALFLFFPINNKNKKIYTATCYKTDSIYLKNSEQSASNSWISSSTAFLWVWVKETFCAPPFVWPPPASCSRLLLHDPPPSSASRCASEERRRRTDECEGQITQQQVGETLIGMLTANVSFSCLLLIWPFRGGAGRPSVSRIIKLSTNGKQTKVKPACHTSVKKEIQEEHIGKGAETRTARHPFTVKHHAGRMLFFRRDSEAGQS